MDNSRDEGPRRAEKWGRIYVAVATGLCIVALAFVSKRLLATPIRAPFLAIPPLLMFLYELVAPREDRGVLSKPVFWVTIIVASTAAVMLLHFL